MTQQHACALLKEAARNTMGFDMQRLPLVQSMLLSVFRHRVPGLSVRHIYEGAEDWRRVPGMCERDRRVCQRFLALLPHDRLVRDVYAELAQDMDTDALDEAARVYDPVSMELQHDAQAVRSRGAFVINFEQAQELARDLDEKAGKVLRLEQRCAALEDALRMAINGIFPVWTCAPSQPQETPRKGPVA
nr:hypothetical protein [uncultured Neokomagataea sp.]